MDFSKQRIVWMNWTVRWIIHDCSTSFQGSFEFQFPYACWFSNKIVYIEVSAYFYLFIPLPFIFLWKFWIKSIVSDRNVTNKMVVNFSKIEFICNRNCVFRNFRKPTNNNKHICSCKSGRCVCAYYWLDFHELFILHI